MNITTIGIDIAKSVFQVHGVDAVRPTSHQEETAAAEVLDVLRGLPPCLVGIEACATAHHWAREI